MNFRALSSGSLSLYHLSHLLIPHSTMSEAPTEAAATQPSSDLDAFCAILSSSKCPGILTGAGLSAASGITTYRGTNGQWLTTVRHSHAVYVLPSTYASPFRIPWKSPLSKLSKIIPAVFGRTIIPNAISTSDIPFRRFALTRFYEDALRQNLMLRITP